MQWWRLRNMFAVMFVICGLTAIGITVSYVKSKNDYDAFVASGVRNANLRVFNTSVEQTRCTSASVGENCYVGVIDLNVTASDTTIDPQCYVIIYSTKTETYDETHFKINDLYVIDMNIAGSYTSIDDHTTSCSLKPAAIPVVEKIGLPIGLWCFAVIGGIGLIWIYATGKLLND